MANTLTGRAALLGLGLLALASGDANARNKIIDGGNTSGCAMPGGLPTETTASSVSIGVSTNFDCTLNQAFSVKIGNTTYTSLFVNENGTISFGAPVSAAPGTALSSLSVPTFAPFFANGAFVTTDPEALTYGYTTINGNAFFLNWGNWIAADEPSRGPNIFQLAIVQIAGAPGDFDLIYNYDSLRWDSPINGAQAGLTLGDGVALLLPGFGTPGAYLGRELVDSLGNASCESSVPATALACNNTNDGSQPVGRRDDATGQLSNGYYLFKFRNGQLVNGVSEVPLPAAAWLFLGGFALLARRRIFRR